MKNIITETLTGSVESGIGKIQGKVKDGVCAFKGIPYAEAPVGNLRFRRPEPKKAWDGVLDCTKAKPICPQFAHMQIGEPESEDCLFINIFTPDINGKFPVLFFIHGGAFAGGSGSQYLYDGVDIAKKGIVVVTLNYRLAGLGMFDFSFLDKKFDNNIALRDQVEALRWVNKNIANFGGNPDDVTIMGQSAGAISVVCLLNIPSARPYFKKAISLSAFPNMIRSKEQGEDSARKLAEILGVKTAEDLIALSAEEITAGAGKLVGKGNVVENLNYVMPIADGEFLPEKPLAAASAGCSYHVPLMMSYTNDEVDILFHIPIVNGMARQKLDTLKSDIEESYTVKLDTLYSKSKRGNGKIGRDYFIRIPSEWYALENAKYAPTWTYRFDYTTPFLKIMGINSMHAIDLLFIFGNLNTRLARILFPLSVQRLRQYKVSARIQADILRFVITGVCPWKTFDFGNTTKVYSGDSDYYMGNEENAVRELWRHTGSYKEYYIDSNINNKEAE